MPITINTIATDDIINNAEKVATVTISGTMTSGATVTLTFDGTAKAGTVTYPTATTWSYTLLAADYTAMLEGGATIVATASDASVASRNIAVDTVLPTVVITDSAPATATGLVTYTFTFSEPVTNFFASDILVTGGAKRAFAAQSATVYTLQVLPTNGVAAGNVTVDVAANAAFDAAGNGNAAATQATQAYNTVVAPVAVASNTVAITAVVDNHGKIQGNLTNGGTTSDNQLDLSGTLVGGLNAGDVVKVYDGATPLGNATVSGNSWAYTDNTRVLSEAQVVNYSVRVENGAAFGTAGTFSATVDRTPPPSPAVSASITGFTDNVGSIVGNVANGGYTDDSTLVLNGTNVGLVGTDTVHVYRTDVATNTTVDIGNATVVGGTWTFNDSGAGYISGNSYRYSVRVVDAAGNIGVSNNGYTINYDNVIAPPAVTGISTDTGVSSTDGVTSDRTLFIQGTSEIGASVIVYNNAVALNPLAPVVANGAGVWIYNYTATTLTDGSVNLFTATQKDQAGNPVSAQSAAFTAKIDITAPATVSAITSVADDVGLIQGNLVSGDYTDDLSLVLTGTNGALGSDANGAYVVGIYDGTTRLGTATQLDATNWTYTDSSLTHLNIVSYTSRVEDVAGNGVSSAAFKVNVDVQPPLSTTNVVVSDNVGAITGDLVTIASGFTDDASLVLSGTINGNLYAGDTVRVYDGATLLGNATVVEGLTFTWTYNDIARADKTTMNYSVVIQDQAGNQTTPVTVLPITFDLSVPTATVSITKFTDNMPEVTGTITSGGTSNDTTPLIEGTITGTLVANDYVHIFRDGKDIGNATVAGATWSFADNLPGGGSYSYTAQVRDIAGNFSALSAAYTVTVDTVIPRAVGDDGHSSATTIAYTFDEAMNGALVPAAGDFAVKVNGTPTAVTNVAIASNVLTLTVNSGSTASVVDVIYTSGVTPLQDLGGNALGSFHFISGGSGADTINTGNYTTAGTDVIWGEAGADTIDAGDGDDTIAYNSNATFVAASAVIDSVTGGNGTDKIQVTGAITLATTDSLARVNTVEQLVTTSSTAVQAHSIKLNSDATLGSISTIDLSNNTNASSTSVIDLTGTVTRAMTLTGVLNGTSTITGGGGADIITGSAGANVITGGAGADTITGGAANDLFIFAAGELNSAGLVIDSITAGAGTDKLQVSGAISLTSLSRVTGVEQLVATAPAGAQVHSITANQANLSAFTTIDLALDNNAASTANINLTGVTASMTLAGVSAGKNTITAGSGNDVITGSSVNDTIDAGSGNDTITSGAGADSIVGGSGDDVFNFVAGTGLTTADTVDGGKNSDTVALTTNTIIAATDFDNVSNIELITVQNSNTTVTITTKDTLVAAGAVLTLSTAANAAKLTFNGAAELNGSFNITGGTVADSIVGGTEGDIINGGTDTLVDTLIGGEGNDTYVFNSMAQLLSGNNIIDSINDTGTTTADRLMVKGAITIAAANLLTTAVGVDQLVAASQSASALTHSIALNKGNEGTVFTFDLSGDTNAGSKATINLSSLKSGRSVTIDTIKYTLMESMGVTNGNNTIIGGQADDFIYAGNGIDSLDGGGGAYATFYFNAGSLTSADTVVGNTGTFDTVYVMGDKAINATDFNGVTNINAITLENVSTNVNITTLDGLVASGDVLSLLADTNNGKLTFNGAAETNASFIILAGNGDDSIVGGSGNDSLVGNVGNDTIAGGAGGDTVSGGAGDDLLTFVAGTGLTNGDVVDGGAGVDTLALTGNVVTTGKDFQNVSNIEFITFQNTTTNVVITAGDLMTAVDTVLTVNASGLTTGTLLFDGSSELDGKFSITGSKNNDTITGGALGDYFESGLGVDSLVGGDGGDTFVFAAGASGLTSTDFVDGGRNDLATDTLILTGDVAVGATDFNLVTNFESIVLSNKTTNVTITAQEGLVWKNTGLTLDASSLTTGKLNFDGNLETNGSYTIIGGAADDTIKLGAATLSDTVRVMAGGSDAAGVDKISNFQAVATTGDKLDLISSTIAANAAAVDGAVNYNTIKSHSIASGMIKFDDLDAYAAPLVINAANLADVNNYLATNIASGETVAFYVDISGDGLYTAATDYLRVFQGGATAAGSLSTDDIFVDIFTTTPATLVTALSATAAAATVVII